MRWCCLCRQLDAEVLALFMAPSYQYPIYVEIVPPVYPDEEEYRARMLRKGEEIMASIAHAAT